MFNCTRRNFLIGGAANVFLTGLILSTPVGASIGPKKNLIVVMLRGGLDGLSAVPAIGDKKFKDRKLRQVIASEESKFWKFISNKKYLNTKRIKLDERLLLNFYKNKGYYDAKIETSTATFINDQNFELTYNISAGKKFIFNNLNISLPIDYDVKNFKDIS